MPTHFAGCFAAMLMLWSGTGLASSLELATTDRYYVDIEMSAEVEGCPARIMQALRAKLVKTVADIRKAQGHYLVRVELVKTGGMRKALTWEADAYSGERHLLFSDKGEETGWTIQGACFDAAEDIAAALGDRIRDARVNRARLPLPERPPHKPRPIVTDDGYTVAPADPVDDIKAKPIQPGQPPAAIKGEARWRPLAERFARDRGCSAQLEHVQSLPTGVETYVTQCGPSAEALITCASGECVLSY